MKRNLRTLLTAALAILLMAAIIVPTVMVIAAQSTETTIPDYFYDFAASDDAPLTFSQTADMTISKHNGYTTFTATGDDPQTYLPAPTCPAKQARYAAIC